MSDEFELRISDVSEIEALELQNEIEEHTQSPQPVELSSEPLPNASSSGDPGLAYAVLTYAPQLVPALAAWIATVVFPSRTPHPTNSRTTTEPAVRTHGQC